MTITKEQARKALKDLEELTDTAQGAYYNNTHQTNDRSDRIKAVLQSIIDAPEEPAKVDGDMPAEIYAGEELTYGLSAKHGGVKYVRADIAASGKCDCAELVTAVEGNLVWIYPPEIKDRLKSALAAHREKAGK